MAQVVGATDVYDGRAVALADLSNRGVLDVIVANQRGPLLVYKNTVQPGRHWIDVRARRHGEQPQRDRRARRAALERPACRCRRSAAAAASARRTSGGCTTAWAPSTSVDRVVIRWPSGRVQTIEKPPVDTLHHQGAQVSR